MEPGYFMSFQKKNNNNLGLLLFFCLKYMIVAV